MNIQLNMEFRNLMSRHIFFARRVRLNSSRVLKPSPYPLPHPRGELWTKLISSNSINPSTVLLGTPPKIRIALLNFERIIFGRRKHYITYVGRACDTGLIRTSFPPFERNFENQELILLWSLSLTKAKTCVLEPWIFSERPRYVPMPHSWEITRVFFITFLVWTSTLFPNITEDLDRLISYHEASPYRRIIFMISWLCCASAL